jgi:hypothetical protein
MTTRRSLLAVVLAVALALPCAPAFAERNQGYKVRVVLEGGRVKTVQVDSNGHISGSN